MKGYWNGWWDQPSEGTFLDANNAQKLSPTDYQPWFLGEPNGGDQENCGMVWSAQNAWNDKNCRRILCGFCQLDNAPVFTLRGMMSKYCVVHNIYIVFPDLTS